MIDVLSLSKERLSQIEGMNSSIATFEADENIWGWKIKKGGTSHDSGTLIDELYLNLNHYNTETLSALDSKTLEEMSQIDAGVDITNEIFSTDLDDGSNRLNVYGIDMSDNWDGYTA